MLEYQQQGGTRAKNKLRNFTKRESCRPDKEMLPRVTENKNSLRLLSRARSRSQAKKKLEYFDLLPAFKAKNIRASVLHKLVKPSFSLSIPPCPFRFSLHPLRSPWCSQVREPSLYLLHQSLPQPRHSSSIPPLSLWYLTSKYLFCCG